MKITYPCAWFSRTTVDIESILNVPTRHATKNNLQVKKSPTLTTRNTSNIKRVYDLSTLQQIKSCRSICVLVLLDTDRCWKVLIGSSSVVYLVRRSPAPEGLYKICF
jgi:hypothetical protein